MDDISKSIMEGNLLLASAAVFRSLHDENLDQQDILAKFITASVHLNKLEVFDSRVLSQAMSSDFGFDIPEVVIRSCIRKKLKGSFSPTGAIRNQYQLKPEFAPPADLEVQFKGAQKAQDALTQKLVAYVEGVSGGILDQADKDILVRDFYDYVKGDTRPGVNATHIGLFIIGLNDQSELDVLEQTKQGLVIYEGLRYNSDGGGAALSSDLSIFLDTEIMFSAAGLHGQMRKDIFLDFYNLAKEVSRKANKKSPGKIRLRYFDDTRIEIEKYFGSARAIVDRRERLNPTRDAMVSIVSGCRSKSDVIDKEESFWMRIEKLGIEKDAERAYLSEHSFNIESLETRAQLARDFGWDEDSAGQVLARFSKINFLRKGRSEPPIESIGAIFLSGKNAMRQASFLPSLYLKNDRFVPYSTDLEFFTTWLWSKLGKAFGPNQTTPIAFSVVNRTRVVLSSQLGARIGEEYDRLRGEIADPSVGELRKEEIARALTRLRSIKISPEDVGGNEADLGFLFEDDLVARAAEEHLSLTERVKSGDLARRELVKDQEDKRRLQGDYDALLLRSGQQSAELLRISRVEARRVRRESSVLRFRFIKACGFFARFLYWTVAPVVSVYAIFRLVAPTDTPLAIVGIALAALLPVFGFLLRSRSKLESYCCRMKWRRFRLSRPKLRQEPILDIAPEDSGA